MEQGDRDHGDRERRGRDRGRAGGGRPPARADHHGCPGWRPHTRKRRAGMHDHGQGEREQGGGTGKAHARHCGDQRLDGHPAREPGGAVRQDHRESEG